MIRTASTARLPGVPRTPGDRATPVQRRAERHCRDSAHAARPPPADDLQARPQDLGESLRLPLARAGRGKHQPVQARDRGRAALAHAPSRRDRDCPRCRRPEPNARTRTPGVRPPRLTADFGRRSTSTRWFVQHIPLNPGRRPYWALRRLASRPKPAAWKNRPWEDEAWPPPIACASRAASSSAATRRPNGRSPRCSWHWTAWRWRFRSAARYASIASGRTPICSATNASSAAGGRSPRRRARPGWRK